jgi:NTP pyrophosphatase (non-canonical NTP hydrolase)
MTTIKCLCLPQNDYEVDRSMCQLHSPVTTMEELRTAQAYGSRKFLSFKEFSLISKERHLNWPRKNGDKVPQHDWDLSAWGCAVAEEAGEVCGAIKRINRLKVGYVMNGKPNEPKSMDEALLKLKKEIGDTVTYLDLLAQELGSDLEECTQLAFNGVSEREGLPYTV